MAKALYAKHGIRITKADAPQEPKKIFLEWGSDLPLLNGLQNYIKEDRNKKIFTDFKIIVKTQKEDVEFPCHKIMLAAKSPFFKAIFEGPYKESKASEFTFSEDLVSNLEPEAVTILLDYLYEEKTIIPSSTSLEILMQLGALSEYLGLQSLKFQCQDLLVENIQKLLEEKPQDLVEEKIKGKTETVNERIQVLTVGNISEFALKYNFSQLALACTKFFAKKINDDNVKELSELASQYNLNELALACTKFLTEKVAELSI